MSERQVGPQGPEMDVEANRAEKTEKVAAAEAAEATVIDVVAVDVAKKDKAPASLIPMHDNQLAPMDHSQLARFVDQMIKAEAVPRHLKNAAQVMSAWNFAAQLQLPPQPSLRNVAVIEGSPSLFGDLPLALVQRHKDFVYYEEFNIDEKYNRISFENKNLDVEPWGGVILIQRKGMKAPLSYAFTLIDANNAGLIERANKKMPWHTYRGTMYIRKARIKGIRAHFADALSGANIAEDFGFAPDLVDVTDTATVRKDMAKDLNGRFAAEPPQHAESQVQ